MLQLNSDIDDIALLKKWRATKSPMYLSELLRRMDGLIQTAVNKYASNSVPRSVIEADAKKWAVKAFEDFKEDKGVKLSTYVMGYMKKLYRTVGKYQNVARIPEHKIMKIKPLESAKSFLYDELGRNPTYDEISNHLGWSKKHVIDLDNSIRKDVAASTGLQDQSHQSFSPQLEVIRMAYFSLSQEEKDVYDYTIGDHGKPRLNPGQIAIKMKMSPSKISKIRNSIAKKLSDHTRNT